MWLNLSGEASTWQDALTPHLGEAERWLQLKLRGERDVEEARAEAFAHVCQDAAHSWQPGTGLRLSLVYAVRHVRAGRNIGGIGLGYGRRHHCVATQAFPNHWEESVRGREVSPVQHAQWSELKEALPPLLSLAAERLVSGDGIEATAKVVRLNRRTLRKRLEDQLERFRRG